MRKCLAFTFCFGLVSAAGLYAQQETHRFSFDLGGGFTQPVGNTGRHLDTGWNVQGGAGYNFSPYLGAMLQLDFNHMGVNSFTLNNLGFPGGDVQVFSATVDPIVHLNPHGRVDFYLIGGGGVYHWLQEFTQPSVSTFTAFDPFFGAFYPVAVPTTQILSSYAVNKWGVNGGAGVALGSKWNGKFFAEARYDRVLLGHGRHSDYLPISFGFRW
ncbi:MAG TPA: outer membrane beta-barrel protein [Bryobacteraceae bacterium]|nr:outer membrane beta-barrel protein [Bryobacteraceae bacterium]